MKKLTIPVLVLALLLSLLTGCAGGKTPETAEEPAPETVEATEAPEAGDAGADDADAAYQALQEQIVRMGGTFDPDTVIATVNGRDLTWRMYYYFISADLQEYIYYTMALPESFDTALTDEVTLNKYFNDSALSQSIYYIVADAKADEMGAALSEETLQSLDEYMAGLAESYGGEEALREAMRSSFLDEELFMFLVTASEKLSAMSSALYGAEGEKLTDEEVLDWAREKGYVRTKHILFYFYDENYQPLDDEAIAERKTRAESVLAELKDLSEDRAALEARFDEIMNAESGDTGGLLSFPEGYTFAAGTMVDAYEQAAFSLEDYALSDVVETSYGYHILLRLPLSADGMTMDQNSSTGAYMTLRQSAANDLFAGQLVDWINEAEVVWTEGFEDLDLNVLLATLTDGAADAAPDTAQSE